MAGVETLAQQILKFVSYGIFILVIMLIWEVIQWFRGGTEDKEKRTFANLTDWSKSPVLNMFRKHSRRKKVRLLNEQIEEEKGFRAIDNIREKILEAASFIKSLLGKSNFSNTGDRNKLVTRVELVKKAIVNAKNEYKRVTRSTWRQETETKRLLDQLKEKGQKTEDLEALENDILALHKQAKEDLDKALGVYDTQVGPLIQVISKLNPAGFPVPFTATVNFSGRDYPLRTVLLKIDSVLSSSTGGSIIHWTREAEEKQKKVTQLIQGIIAELRGLWS